MGVRFPAGINLLNSELENARLQNLVSNPASNALGQMFFDISINRPKWYAGSTDGWVTALANLTRLNEINAPTAAVGFNLQRITGLADGVAQQDAATVKQLSDLATSTGTYVHTQSVPVAVWVVQHNLGRRPSVSMFDSAGEQCEGDVEHVDDNQLTITSAGAFSGVAYIGG